MKAQKLPVVWSSVAERDPDLFIAACTLAVGGTLVTNNVREFARVPGLLWESWAESAGSEEPP